MNIADELMEYANKFKNSHDAWSGISDDLTAIADRINMEHERRMVERADLYSELRAKMNNCYIELPKDADGVPWNPGDRDEDGNEVFELVLNSDGWYLVNGTKWVNKADSIRHYHAPTVEDVLREFTDAILDWAGKSGTVAEVGTWSDVAAEYIAKLQLKEY